MLVNLKTMYYTSDMGTQQSINVIPESIKERGHINIKMAKYLWKLKSNNDLNFDTNINHIIIGRMYYGIYLLAKAELIEKSICYETKRLMHKPYKDKNSELVWTNVIWNEITNIYDECHSVNLTKGSQLARKREYFEYNHHLCNDNDVIWAFKSFIRIYKVLR